MAQYDIFVITKYLLERAGNGEELALAIGNAILELSNEFETITTPNKDTGKPETNILTSKDVLNIGSAIRKVDSVNTADNQEYKWK